MTRLLLIRHGESEGNRLGVFVGHTDLPLTDRGRQQAALTAQFLDPYPIDVLYASDLRRAYETALPLAERRGLPVHKDPQLREINGGDWEMKPFKELANLSPDDYRRWSEHLGACRCPGGESVAELQTRIRTEVDRLTALHAGKTICIATHATPIRVMKCVWLGLGLDQISSFGWAPNASVTLVEARADGGYTLLLDGEDKHLAGLQTLLPKEI